MSEAAPYWEPKVGDRVGLSLAVGLTMSRRAEGEVVRVTATQVLVRDDGRREDLPPLRFRKDPHSSRLFEVKAGARRSQVWPL